MSKNLSSAAKKMYIVAKVLLTEARKLRQQGISSRWRMEEIKYLIESGPVNKTVARFLETQLKLQKTRNRRRRFSVDDKLFALSLLKHSPKWYRLLSKIIELPSRKTLLQLLKKIQSMDNHDRFCCLMFDEIRLEPALHYDCRMDIVMGFEDVGKERRPKLADRAAR